MVAAIDPPVVDPALVPPVVPAVVDVDRELPVIFTFVSMNPLEPLVVAVPVDVVDPAILPEVPV